MDKQKKWVFVVLILLILGGLTFTFLVTSYITKDKPEKEAEVETPTEQVSEKEPVTKPVEKEVVETGSKEDGKSDEPNKPLKAEDIFKKPESKNNRVISESESILYENTARNHYRKFEFSKGYEYLFEPTRTYKNDEFGTIVHTLYEDGSMLAGLGYGLEDTGTEGHVTSLDGMYSLLQGVRDPEMALLGMLSIDLKERNELLMSLDSLNPVFEGNVQITSKTEAPKDVVDTLSIMFDVKKVHRIDFAIEGNSLFAYVIENSEGYSYVNAIYEKEVGTTSYVTVRKWSELFKTENSPETIRDNNMGGGE